MLKMYPLGVLMTQVKTLKIEDNEVTAQLVEFCQVEMQINTRVTEKMNDSNSEWPRESLNCLQGAHDAPFPFITDLCDRVRGIGLLQFLGS